MTPADLDSVLADKSKLYDHMLEVAKANGFESLTDAISRAVKAEARIRTLEGVLEPFAQIKGNYSHQPDSMKISVGFGQDERFTVTLGELRRAQSALRASRAPLDHDGEG